MIKKIKCKNCGMTIEIDHGNIKHCEPCKKKVKERTSSKRYAQISLKADPYWLNEKILREHYDEDMDPDILESLGFDFELYNFSILPRFQIKNRE